MSAQEERHVRLKLACDTLSGGVTVRSVYWTADTDGEVVDIDLGAKGYVRLTARELDATVGVPMEEPEPEAPAPPTPNPAVDYPPCPPRPPMHVPRRARLVLRWFEDNQWQESSEYGYGFLSDGWLHWAPDNDAERIWTSWPRENVVTIVWEAEPPPPAPSASFRLEEPA